MMIKEFSSFRDPSGFVFYKNDKIYRSIHASYFATYGQIKAAGIYEELITKELLIKHTEATGQHVGIKDSSLVLEVEKIPFISYPYEWSFSQLKDAALLTLRIQNFLLDKNFSLKDASAYNIQFYKGKPVFIDTLSFEAAEETPWKAYRQFCQHFLAPLLLMKYADTGCQHLLKSAIDGIPLSTTVNLLPFWLRFKPSVYMHIYLQQNYSARFSNNNKKIAVRKFPVASQKRILNSLFDLVSSLHLSKINTEWGDYYSNTNYDDTAMLHKKQLLEEVAAAGAINNVWDLGGNTGFFSRVFSEKNINTICFDIDPLAVEKNYQQVKAGKEQYLLPLLFDVINPSPGIGWDNSERTTISQRMKPDLILSLALIHHLFITYNCSFEMISGYLAANARCLVMEFVPLEDSQTQKLVMNRTDDFSHYSVENFEAAFSRDWSIVSKTQVNNTCRFIYTLNKK